MSLDYIECYFDLFLFYCYTLFYFLFYWLLYFDYNLWFISYVYPLFVNNV